MNETTLYVWRIKLSGWFNGMTNPQQETSMTIVASDLINAINVLMSVSKMWQGKHVISAIRGEVVSAAQGLPRYSS